ncbi:HTH-type transcriptional regulator SutR [termite gut metagenome]|uniref:HTH-type transcriptional regulator SutR n=1 Tax=termite gut metagenome TaxID=433724 RepID=A0A5J4R619_9ZZZZ
MSSKSILEIFGTNVQKYRKERQLSQEKLAEIAGVHRTYIGMIERAEKNITLCNMEKIAKALNVEIKDLLEKREDFSIASKNVLTVLYNT